MKQMKKVLLSSIAACAIATSANAGVYVGQTSMTINDSDAETGTTIGLTTKSGTGEAGSLYTGFDLAYTMMGLDEYEGDSTLNVIDIGFRIGMNVTSQFSVYGLVSAAFQDTTTDAGNDAGLSDSYGVGYGLGGQFDITKSFAVRGEYKSYSVEADYDDGQYSGTAWEYDMDMTTLSLVLTF